MLKSNLIQFSRQYGYLYFLQKELLRSENVDDHKIDLFIKYE